jgi:phosphopantothenoylcysteine decarboxylase/phosphopantothenate--cysteine ligase
LASGLEGAGRLQELDVIVSFITSLLEKRNSLKGKKIVVTAGPTHEALDPVRYIGNLSSGKMGFAIAQEAAMRGATVTLIAGPTALATPTNVQRVDVVSADELLAATKKAVTGSDVLIMAAAVADFKPTKISSSKIKKSGTGLSVKLVATHDVLGELSRGKGKRIHIGFALETENGLKNATAKLKERKLDMIVLNNAEAIGGDSNAITLIDRDGTATAFDRMTKRECAEVIVEAASRRFSPRC